MQPILYNANTAKSEFDSGNGLGFFGHCTKCTVTEERNGLYELSMSILPTDRLAKCVAVGMFVKILANPHDEPQIFEIYQLSVSDTAVEIKGQHIKYIANGNVISEAWVSTGTPQAVWNDITDLLTFDNVFEFYSDIDTAMTVTAAKDRPIRLGDLLGGIDGSFLDTYGGEYHYNNFKIELLSSRGNETGVCLRYGSNISTYKQDSDINSVYTHLMPYAYLSVNDNDGKSLNYQLAVTLPTLIDLGNEQIAYKRTLAYDFSEFFSEDKLIVAGGSPINWAEMVDKLQTVSDEYIRKNRTALTEIATTITVDVADTLRNLENCQLCDTVQIYYEPLNITAKAKIVKTEYDALNERYTKIEIGTVRKTIADLFNNKNIGGV